MRCHVNIRTGHITFVSLGSGTPSVHRAVVTDLNIRRCVRGSIAPQPVVKRRKKQRLVSIHANIKDPNQACELSTITMLISTSLLCSVQLTVSKSSLCRAQIPLFFTNKVHVSEGMCVSVLWMLMGKMCVVLNLYSPGLCIFPHCLL